ncbi:hypothetical protein [Moorena producens]
MHVVKFSLLPLANAIARSAISVYLIRYERMGGEFSDSSTPALGEIYPLA